MNPNLSKKASSKIEEFCAQGCSQVNQLLENAANGESITELSEFNDSDSKLIIDELVQIMSVYDSVNNDTEQSDADNGFK